ncbi:hypothetical protein LUZ61_005986 [Rhynchospora tenuis]|uniref:HAT C-terminal dimerisation domain-containing protein n=1 Tax=Rhynchospora tenuis TaxID=198213 RepID=A0AAD6EV31_9POAL|nr:hypothetical protein LUZ61_005986 [Rhynchospora tenuis]
MDVYLSEETVDLEDANFDLLCWWKQNRLRYPVVSRIARDVLAVPACVYSVKRSILSSDPSVLKVVRNELAEAVICSKDWILSAVQSAVTEPKD